MQIAVKTNWKPIIESQLQLPYWEPLALKVAQAYTQTTVFPLQSDIFNCFNFFDFEQTKVVIIGQDPYYNDFQADGLAFSVRDNSKWPPTLKNIFNELKNDLNINKTTGDLSDWAKQGVLLLNNVLTVQKLQPNSHSDFGWQTFTDAIIKIIDQNLNGVVFILWGQKAQQKSALIINNRANIIAASHPSPLSAYRGFFNSKPFSKTNNLLIKLHKQPIKW